MEIIGIIENYFQNSSYNIVEIVTKGERSNKIIEVYVDRKEPLNIDDLVEINRSLNTLAEEADDIRHISKLVVSSPGTDRPIKFFWQLSKHINRNFEIKLVSGEEFEGKLMEIGEDMNLLFETIVKEKNKKIIVNRETRFPDIEAMKVKISFK
ncbi:hypothetical protein BH10BAC5_BH10BAC5_04670 [soil metagenome]